MRLRLKVLAVVFGACLACLASYAVVTIGSVVAWPEDWPKELDPFRQQARVCEVSHGIQETVYEIPFKNREEFEKAWPHLLLVRSEKSPLIIEKSPSTYDVSGTTMKAGVRVLCGPGEAIVGSADGQKVRVGPPWPDSLRSAWGELPEYVTVKEGQVVRAARNEGAQGTLFRARVDLMLVADGKVVDLNRVELPEDALIVDRRFEKRTEAPGKIGRRVKGPAPETYSAPVNYLGRNE